MDPAPGRNIIDDAMLDKLVGGDEEAWKRFFEVFDSLIRSIVSWPKWHFSETIREDILQTVRMEIHKSLGRFRKDSSLEYFVKRICIHRCIDEIRKQVRERELMSPYDYTQAGSDYREMMAGTGLDFDPVLAVVLSERASALREILNDMDDTCKNTIESFYFKNQSYKEMAARFNISVITAGTRLAKCLDKLKIILRRNRFFREECLPTTDSHSNCNR